MPMQRFVTFPIAAVLAAVTAVAAAAQDSPQRPDTGFRDFAMVQRLRVVCSKQHVGRIQDLIAEVPSGRVTAAVVVMTADAKAITTAVPFEALRYDAQANLLRLEPCLAEGEEPPAWDPSQVKVTRKAPAGGGKEGDGKGKDGEPGPAAGTVLCSRLATARVALKDGGTATVQDVMIELGSGHLAFLDVTTAEQRAGDNQLHPVPWAALRWNGDDTAPDDKTPLLAMEQSKDGLGKAPTLVQVVLEDPLYRGLVYKYFAVPPPPFERP